MEYELIRAICAGQWKCCDKTHYCLYLYRYTKIWTIKVGIFLVMKYEVHSVNTELAKIQILKPILSMIFFAAEKKRS